MKMSQGEMMVWAAAFAYKREKLEAQVDVFKDGRWEKEYMKQPSYIAACYAREKVEDMQLAKNEFVYRRVEGFNTGDWDAEAMLKFMLGENV